MEGLRDIKGVVAVQDSSLLLLIALLTGITILILLSGYFFLKLKRKKKKKTTETLAKEKLTTIDFSDTKKAAYLFTESGHILSQKNDTLTHQFEMIVSELEPYKFKKEVAALDSDLISKMRDFIKAASHG